MKKLFVLFLSILSITATAQLKVSNGWIPANLKPVSTGGYSIVNGYEVISGTTSVDFDDVAGATHYNLMWCPIRFTKDLSLQGIFSHYPACGTSITYSTPSSYFSMPNGMGLVPGDICVATITAFDDVGNYAYSQVFQFTVAGEVRYCETAGCAEYCSTTGTTPITTAPVTKKKK